MLEALDNITALFATIASPYAPLTAFQQSVLGDAIVTAWERKGNQAIVDDVRDALIEIAASIPTGALKTSRCN